MDNSKKSDTKPSLTRRLGDKIERVGEKLKDMGATKTGNAVYKVGNKIEHSKDSKKQFFNEEKVFAGSFLVDCIAVI